MKLVRKTTLTLIAFVTMFVMSLTPLVSNPFAVNAAAAENGILCSVFPFLGQITFLSGLCGDTSQAGTAATTAVELAKFGASLIFIGIIGISVYVIIKAAVKYIQSEGNEEKVQEAQKAIKNVFIGVGALIVGLIGLVIVLGFFNATEPLSNTENVPNILAP